MEGGEAHASGEATQRRQRATVSDSGAGTSFKTTPRPHVSDKAPLVWRAPEGAAAVPVGGGGAHVPSTPNWRPPRGLRGLAGLRGDAPSEARGADVSRAGRRPPAHTAAGASDARNTRGAASNA